MLEYGSQIVHCVLAQDRQGLVRTQDLVTKQHEIRPIPSVHLNYALLTKSPGGDDYRGKGDGFIPVFYLLASGLVGQFLNLSRCPISEAIRGKSLGLSPAPVVELNSLRLEQFLFGMLCSKKSPIHIIMPTSKEIWTFISDFSAGRLQQPLSLQLNNTIVQLVRKSHSATAPKTVSFPSYKWMSLFFPPVSVVSATFLMTRVQFKNKHPFGRH